LSPVFIGTSGFSYKDWRDGVFYPSRLPAHEYLAFYAQSFGTVELNTTFYHLPQTAAVRGWYKQTPEHFTFAVKGSRFITHIKRLKDPDEPLKLFFSRIKFLQEKAGVVLWQLPPRFNIDVERLKRFVEALQKTMYRHVIEFREESWFKDDVIDLLRGANIAVCGADWPPYNNSVPETADFVYVRRHGTSLIKRYHGSYPDDFLQKDAARVQAWKRAGKDVFLYFNNDYHGNAIRNALTVKSFLGERVQTRRLQAVGS
jgi:uncharacterized protein YecE (DUF72 family)